MGSVPLAGIWKRGRVVEGNSLENCRTGNGIVSSNLTASAEQKTRPSEGGFFVDEVLPFRDKRVILAAGKFSFLVLQIEGRIAFASVSRWRSCCFSQSSAKKEGRLTV